jgi:hypothetical protein
MTDKLSERFPSSSSLSRFSDSGLQRDTARLSADVGFTETSLLHDLTRISSGIGLPEKGLLHNLTRITSGIGLSVAIAIGATGCKDSSDTVYDKCEHSLSSSAPVPCECDKSADACPKDADELYQRAMMKYNNDKGRDGFRALIRRAISENPRFILKKMEENPALFTEWPELYLETVDELLSNDHDIIENDRARSNLSDVAASIDKLKIYKANEFIPFLELARRQMQTAILRSANLVHDDDNIELILNNLQSFDKPEVRNYLRGCVIHGLAGDWGNTYEVFIMRYNEDVPGDFCPVLNTAKIEKVLSVVEQIEDTDQYDAAMIRECTVKNVLSAVTRELMFFGQDQEQNQNSEYQVWVSELESVINKYPQYAHLMGPIKMIFDDSEQEKKAHAGGNVSGDVGGNAGGNVSGDAGAGGEGGAEDSAEVADDSESSDVVPFEQVVEKVSRNLYLDVPGESEESNVCDTVLY